MKIRLKGQYKEQLALPPHLYVKLLITALTAFQWINRFMRQLYINFMGKLNNFDRFLGEMPLFWNTGLNKIIIRWY